MKHAFKKIMALALVIVMILGVLPAASAANVGSFTDVKDTDWFAPYVEQVVFYDLMNGTSKTTFEPNAYATRAMATTVLYRFAGEPPVAKASSFTDVKPGYYSNAVAWAEAEKIVNGVTKTTFEPDAFITREMLVTIFWRYAGSPVIAEDCLKSFPDADKVSAYAKAAMNWAIKRDILNGSKEADGKTYLFPQSYATRAQIAKMFVFLSAALKPCTEHKWDEGVVTKAATCTEVGEKKQTCSECGATQTVAVPATGHTYVDGVCACGDKLATSDEIVIYYTNDVHTYIDGALSYDAIADIKAQTAKVAAGTLLLDAGDHIQGTAYGSMDKGAAIIKMMNAAGYDAATLGNHEFDYGMERALAVTGEESKFPYLSANFYHEKDGVAGDSVLDAYKVFTVGGKKIAVIGITTPESFTKSTPKYFQDENGNYIYGIAGGTDGSALYTSVQSAIDAAKLEKPDYIIALGHLGDDVSSKPWTSEELIANTTGLNAFIDGHSHSTVECKEVKDKDGKTVILTQTGSYFDAIGKMTIKDGKITTELITSYNGSNADVKKIKDEWMADVDKQLGKVIGHADVTLGNYDASGNRLVRKQETNTGDFAADALFYQFKTVQGLDVDAAIMNGGGVRNKAITGDITYKTCKEIHTFGNVACLIKVTGQQLLDALEWGAKDAAPDGSKECGGFLQVSGITYEIHTYITSTVQKDEKGVWTGGPTGEYRVKNVTVGGQPLDVNKTYNLAGYNYTLRDLGDGFAMFKGAENVLDYVKEDYMVLADYVQSFDKDATSGLPTVKTGTGYDNVTGDGRITLVNEKPADTKPSTQTFVKVTSDLTDWAGTYVFGYETGDGKAQIFNGSTDKDGNFITADITDNKVTVDPQYAIEIKAVDGGYTVKASAGYMTNKTNNGIQFSDTAATATIVWKNNAANVTASDGRVFAVNHGNVYGSTTEFYSGWFRFFKNLSGTITPVVLFKLDDGSYTPPTETPSSSTASSEEPVEPEVYTLTSELKNGDKVVFVNKANSLAFSTADAANSDFYRAGVEVTPEDGKLTVTDTALVWTIETTTDGFFLKNAEGKKLSIPTKADGTTYSSINFAQDTHTVWKIATAATSGCVYLQNTTATGTSGDCKSIEWYAGEGKNYFSTYFVSSSNEALFAMEMYVKGATSETPSETPSESSTAGGSTEEPVEPQIPDSSKSVAIFNIANNKVMTTESYTYTNTEKNISKVELKTADATLADSKLTTEATNVALFNVVNNNGVLTFKTSDGKYLFCDGNDVKLVETEGENTKFVLESTNDDGTNFYIRCNTAQAHDKAQYLEYFSNYITCYSLNTEKQGLYVFGLYELAENTSTSESDEPSSSTDSSEEPAEPEYLALFNPASQSLVSVEETVYTNPSNSTSKEELEMVESGLIQDEASEAAGMFTAKEYAKAEKVALFEVVLNEDDTVSFKTKDGKFLYADGTNVKLTNTESEEGHTSFIKEEVKLTPEGSTEAEVIGFHLKCSKAVVNNNAQYLEIYKGCLTVYGNTTYTDLTKGDPENDNYLFDLNELHVCDHTYAKDDTNSKAATCTEPGEEVMLCSKCKFSYSNEIDALGHEDNDGDGKCNRVGCGADVNANEWTIATDIKEGDVIALVAKCGDAYYALSNTMNAKNNKFTSATVTVTDGKLDVGENAVKWTVCKGEATGKFVLKTPDGKFLNYTSSTNVSLNDSKGYDLEITVGDGTSCISFGEVGSGNSKNTRNLFFQKYNNSGSNKTTTEVFGAYAASNAKDTTNYSSVLTIWKLS